MDQTYIREATLDDAKELLNIYAPYVKKTAITFEYEVPTLEEFRRRMADILKKYPYIVAVTDGEITGYAYAGTFVGRSAYDWSAETTIYLKESKRRMGIGRKLYETLEKICILQNIKNLYACISYPREEDVYLTKNSVQYHTHLGYHVAGEFHKCGYKFGRWYDMVWMEKMIGAHDGKIMPLISFPELDKKVLKTLGLRDGI